MVSLSFSSFMLVMLLFIFLTIKDTIVHTDDQVKQMVHEAENDKARILSHLSVEKEVLDGVPAAAEFRIGKMERRKMMIDRKKDMKEGKKTESSGNYDRHLGHDARKNVHHQLRIYGNERDLASTHKSKNDDQSDDNGSFQNLESENFQDDATDFFTMNKDYVGTQRPRHKVPVPVTRGD